MRLKEKNLLQKFAATLKKFSAQGAIKVEYGNIVMQKSKIMQEFTFATIVECLSSNFLAR